MKSQVVAMLIISMTTTKQWEKNVGQRRRFWIHTKWYQNTWALYNFRYVAFIGHLLFLVEVQSGIDKKEHNKKLGLKW